MPQSPQVYPAAQMTTDGFKDLDYEHEIKACGCCWTTGRYTTKIRHDSIKLESETSGCFLFSCIGCCTRNQQRIIPYASVQSVGTTYGGFLEALCCVKTHKVWVATIASGLRWPHSQLVGKKEDTDAIMDAIQHSMVKKH